MKTSNSGICITGAHRSGTSMLTRLLHRCGLHLGSESDLMPAASDNPDGFWEHLRFVQLNDEVLNAVGAAWDLPPLPNEDFTADRLGPIRRKAELLIEGFDNGPVWGWKDPRNCLTFPFWNQLLPGLKTIVIVRHPLEAAYSMNERNGTSYALGLRLWEIYHRHLISHTNPQERFITSYERFFNQPEIELQKVATFAGLPEAETAAAAGLIAAHRRHTKFSLEQLIDAGVSESLVILYRSLLAEASGGASVMPDRLGHTRPEKQDPLKGAANPIDLSLPAAETVRRELAWRRGAEIEHREQIARRDGRIEELQREQSQRHQEIHKLRERFFQTNQLLQTTSVRLSDFETRNRSLEDRFRKQLLEMKRLLRWLDQIDEAAGLLRKSRRWKLANPFAAIWAMLAGKPLQGFGHLDKNVERYRTWRSAHPELASLDAEIQALRPREIPLPLNLLESNNSAKPVGPANVRPPLPTEPIEFRPHDEVIVSIIIPFYNQTDYTLSCLASVQRHSNGIPYEVIIVDDCSTDATLEAISDIPGIIYLRSEANMGFIASCNLGAAAARGTYLVFLNNDTVVTAGWLAALHQTFELKPEAGLVGSKLVYPDGRLQEAGGIVWRDGSGWNRGKFQDPANPEYNYLREVDYCSAASVMIPKSLFDRLGGFDPKYAPAYYEDTDLAFKAAQDGRKIFYQPLSVVIHYEGVTGGTDISSGTKKYQDVNRATFISSWARVLETKPENGDLLAYERLPPGKKRVLVIDHHLPTPDRDSGSLRMFQILTILCQLGHRVTFIPDNLTDVSPYGDNLRRHGVEVMHYPYTSSVREYLHSKGAEFEVVILSRCDFARKHIVDVRLCAPEARLIFDTVDLHFLREEREAALISDPQLKQAAAAKRKLEYFLIDQADETWVVSPAERDLLQRDRPDKPIAVVSNIVEVPGSATPFSLRRDILFIGSFQHPPNTDAMLFFAREIFPHIQQELPEITFYIIGDKAPPEVIALADEHIVVTGYQPDVGCYFDRIKLSVAPLRFGAGVKGKINQSMGFGVPVVATSVAVEGMDLTDRKDVMIADIPQAFANAVIKLYTSEKLWNQISSHAIERTNALYSVDAARKRFRRLFNDPSVLTAPQSFLTGVCR